MIKINGYNYPRYRKLGIESYKKVAPDSEIETASGEIKKMYIGELHRISVESVFCPEEDVKALREAVAVDLIPVEYTDSDGAEKAGVFRCEGINADMTNRIGTRAFYNVNFTLEEAKIP